MSRMLMLSGSQRRESFNSRLLSHVAGRLPGYLSVDSLEFRDCDLPMFNQDLETDAPTVERVVALHQRVLQADGLIVASPEYNCLPTPYLKNVVDWISRLPRIDPKIQNAFHGLPVLLCSASTGWSGGVSGLTSARTLFSCLGAIVVGEQISVAQADKCWTGDRYRFGPAIEDHIGAVLERFAMFTGNQALAKVI